VVIVIVVVAVIREVVAMTASATARDSARVKLLLKRTARGSFVARPVVGLKGGGWVVLLPRPDAASNGGGGWERGLVVSPWLGSMGEKSCGSSARAVGRSRQTWMT
jgi:hypothetical protein